MRYVFAFFLTILGAEAAAEGLRPHVLDPAYDHDRFVTQPVDVARQFRAFTVSFDSDDDDDGDGEPDRLGVPHWVAYQVNRATSAPESKARPTSWFTDQELAAKGFAPLDSSYAYSKDFRKRNPNWYDRGHLAQKYLAERMGADAAWNTHSVLNAVPQRGLFNSGIWLDLECKTGAWANRFGTIWVVTGPLFLSGKPTRWIGERAKREVPVAIPDALFKIVIRVIAETPSVDILAFIYPQDHPTYRRRPWDHTLWLTTVDRIERLTGLDFLTKLPLQQQQLIERRQAKALWPHEKSEFDPGCRSAARDFQDTVVRTSDQPQDVTLLATPEAMRSSDTRK